MNDKTTPWHSPPEVWNRLKPLARQMRHDSTPEEGLVWEQLRSRRFHGLRFRRQHTIGPYIVDFYCDEKQLIIEVDGDIHLFSIEEDAIRQDYLESRGFTVVRLHNYEVQKDMNQAFTRISKALENLPSPQAERGRG